MSSSGENLVNLNQTEKAKTKTQNKLRPVLLGMDHEIN